MYGCFCHRMFHGDSTETIMASKDLMLGENRTMISYVFRAIGGFCCIVLGLTENLNLSGDG